MITFDPATKIIQLDSVLASSQEIWTAMVNWAAMGDNLKYGVGLSQIGGVAPVALYITLERGWLIRPMEADGVTTITGNILVNGGGSPIASTLGSFNVLVNLETPVQAAAIEVANSDIVTIEALLLSDQVKTTVDEVTTVTYYERGTNQSVILRTVTQSGDPCTGDASLISS